MKFTPTLGGSYSGSLGGFTASHNKGGQYLRRRAVPTNPNTVRQQTARAALGALTEYWGQTLTESQRQGWRDYAAAVPVTDRIGNTINLTGQQMFVRSNTPAAQYSNTTLTTTSTNIQEDAPSINNTGEPPSSILEFELANDGSTLSVSGNVSAPASDGGTVFMRIGPHVSPGVNAIKSTLQLASTVTINSAATAWDFADLDITAATEWVAQTVPLLADDGLRFPIAIRIRYDDGRLSQKFTALVPLTVAAP